MPGEAIHCRNEKIHYNSQFTTYKAQRGGWDRAGREVPLTTSPAVPTLHPEGLQCRLSAAGLSIPPTWAAVAQRGLLIGLARLWWRPAPPKKDIK